jgi:hypothetical protein
MKKFLFILLFLTISFTSHAILKIAPNEHGDCMTVMDEFGDYKLQCMDQAYYAYVRGNEDSAVDIWIEFADGSNSRSNSEALYNIGVHLYNNLIDESQRKLAFEYIREAARIHPTIYTDSAMGYMFKNGLGVKKNEKLALSWFERAARLGDLDSQTATAEMYFNGIGVKEDKKQAFNWYLEAAKQGHLDSQQIIAEMYFKGIGVREDKKQAFNWYLEAGDDGFFKTKYMIGLMYQDGIGTEKNTNQAFIWLLKAINQGEELELNMETAPLMTLLADAKIRKTLLLEEASSLETNKQSGERNNCNDYDADCWGKVIKKQYEGMQTCNGPIASVTDEMGKWLLASCLQEEPRNINGCYQIRLNNWKDFILDIRSMQQIGLYCKNKNENKKNKNENKKNKNEIQQDIIYEIQQDIIYEPEIIEI